MSQPAALPVPIVIFAAILMSQLVLVAVSFAVPPGGSNPSIGPFLVLPAAATAGLSLVAPHLFGPKFDRLTLHILRWALAESATILGFVAAFMGAPRLFQAACTAMGLVAMFAAFPPRDLAGPPRR
ncbi:MAG: hypothetical protein FJ102_00605 [Deltaproteobacteria bacterium]|nr:hypothetical protein [Deltaproteobacteria bacterium]